MLSDLKRRVVHVVVIEPADIGAHSSARVLCTNAGYVTFVATTGSAGLELAERIRPDVIVLDVAVSEPAGAVVLRHLQARQHCPIVVVGESAAELSQCGDGPPVPVSHSLVPTSHDPERVAEAVELALGDWWDHHDGADAVEYGDLVLDMRYQQAFTGGRRVPLAPRLFRLLAVLVLFSGQTVLIDELADVIGTSIDNRSDRRSLQDAASKLRQSLRVSGSKVAIAWDQGEGYRVTAEA